PSISGKMSASGWKERLLLRLSAVVDISLTCSSFRPVRARTLSGNFFVRAPAFSIDRGAAHAASGSCWKERRKRNKASPLNERAYILAASDQLQATAEQSRRTVSAEIEFRLEHSYQVDWVDAQMKALYGMGIKDGLLIPGLGELGSVEPIKRWATRFAKRLADIEAEERRLKKSERRHETP